VQRGAHYHYSLISHLNASPRTTQRLSASCHKFVHFRQMPAARLLRSSMIFSRAWGRRAFPRVFNYTF
jgi:hypothetical protein